MSDKDIKRSATTTVRHSLDGEWSQHDFGEAFEVSSLSVIAELDPLGERGVLREVLELFLTSLEPELDRLEHLDLEGDSGKQLAFEVHRLGSAAGQLRAVRLAAACVEFRSTKPAAWRSGPRRRTRSFAAWSTSSWRKSFVSSAACERC